jgi:hypothetical protein
MYTRAQIHIFFVLQLLKRFGDTARVDILVRAVHWTFGL